MNGWTRTYQDEGTRDEFGEPALEDWGEAVDHFPVETFCDEIESTGAKWVIWPFSHAEGRPCAPNSVLETYVPGTCSKRDLFGEIAETLTRQGMGGCVGRG